MPHTAIREPKQDSVKEKLKEKPVFGITKATREKWSRALEGSDEVSEVEATDFLQSIFQRCVNLLPGEDAKTVTTNAFVCIEAWLQVRSCPPCPRFHL